MSEATRDAIDWDTLKLEPGSFIDADLADSHTDVLFSVDFRGTPALLYLLLEHQSTNDRWMPLRIAKYEALILARYHSEHPDCPLPIVFPLVVSHAVGGWRSPMWLHELFDPPPASTDRGDGVINCSYYVDDLAGVTDDELRARALGAMLTMALAVQRDARDPELMVAHPNSWAETYKAVERTQNGVEAIARVVRYVYLRLDVVNYERFRDNLSLVIPTSQEAIMNATISAGQQKWIEGRAEGEQQGRIAVIERQLERRFGSLAVEHQQLVRSASAEQLDRYIDKVLTAHSIDEVFAEP